MSDPQTHRLSGEEIAALRFAARRQVTRWSKRRELRPREQLQRAALIRAIRILEDRAFTDGCELLRPTSER